MTAQSKGIHICALCTKQEISTPQYPVTSSGNVVLWFDDGTLFVVPDMILHYCADHRYQPPEQFVTYVLHKELMPQTEEENAFALMNSAHQIGYLDGPIEEGEVQWQFVSRLKTLIEESNRIGRRLQTKNI